MPRPNSGARLKLNDRGIYEIRWTEAGRSKRSSTGTSDLQSAEKVLGNFLLLDEREARIEEANGAMLVCAALGDRHSGWKSEADGPRPKDYWHEHVLAKVVSIETVEYAFDKLHRHFGHIAIADLMPDDVTAYVDARRAGTIGRPSINHTITRELSVLNAAIHHAVKAKRLPKSDQPFIQTPGTSPPKDRWLTYDEADRLIAAAREEIDPRQPKGKLPRVYKFVMLALCTASRRTAVLELQRDQVDMAAGVIYLNPKGREQTNKRRARVPISDELRPVLAQILRETNGDYLLGHDGAIRTSFENAVERAKLGKDVTPHTLRHTKATWLAQAGVSMFDLAGILGDSVATVTKTYAHHHPDYLRSAINAGRRPEAERMQHDK